jgi:hypothetical protein
MEHSNSTTSLMMRADEKTLVGAEVECASMLGSWTNVKEKTDHIVSVVVTERDGSVYIRAFGSSPDGPVDWGEVEAFPHASSGTSSLAGYLARYDFGGGVRTEFAANVKLGVLVIQTYTSYEDGSGRMSHFSREFFVQPPTGTPTTADGTGTDHSLVGDWVNTNPETEWIGEFTIAGAEDDLTMRTTGVREPVDWGEIPITTYMDNLNEPAFRAEYDLGSFTATLACNSNKNLVIIAAFLSFEDTSKNFMCREFFAPRRFLR